MLHREPTYLIQTDSWAYRGEGEDGQPISVRLSNEAKEDCSPSPAMIYHRALQKIEDNNLQPNDAGITVVPLLKSDFE